MQKTTTRMTILIQRNRMKKILSNSYNSCLIQLIQSIFAFSFENLTGATGRIDLRESVELSSDDEDFIYGSDGDINSHHSTAYSKYKKRVMKELDGDVSSETDSDGDEDECISDFE